MKLQLKDLGNYSGMPDRKPKVILVNTEKPKEKKSGEKGSSSPKKSTKIKKD